MELGADAENLMQLLMHYLSLSELDSLASASQATSSMIQKVEGKAGYWYDRLVNEFPDYVYKPTEGINPELLYLILDALKYPKSIPDPPLADLRDHPQPYNMIRTLTEVLKQAPYYTDQELINLLKYLRSRKGTLFGDKEVPYDMFEGLRDRRKVQKAALALSNVKRVTKTMTAPYTLVGVGQRAIMADDWWQITAILDFDPTKAYFLMEQAAIGLNADAYRRIAKDYASKQGPSRLTGRRLRKGVETLFQVYDDDDSVVDVLVAFFGKKGLAIAIKRADDFELDDEVVKAMLDAAKS